MKHPLTQKRWQTIITNQIPKQPFFYGVKTTHIFCRPNCPSKIPKRENVVIFANSDEALIQGFRPCKRCLPTGNKLPNDLWVTEIKQYLADNYQQHLSLEKIATDCHGSVSNLQRTFAKATGISPTSYLQQIRLKHAKELLQETDYSIKTIAARCGFNSDTYFNTCFKESFTQTPQQFRQA